MQKTLFAMLIAILLIGCSTWTWDISNNSEKKAYIDLTTSKNTTGNFNLYKDLKFVVNITPGIVDRLIVEPGVHNFRVEPRFGNKVSQKNHDLIVTAVEDHVTQVTLYLSTYNFNSNYNYSADIKKPVPFYPLKALE